MLSLKLVSHELHPVHRSDKLRWMCTLTPNRRTRFMSTSAHQPGKTEDHSQHCGQSSTCRYVDINSNYLYFSDSPQVQCIQSYSSQEPDELSIEMADVLNLLERTNDGV